MKSPSAERKAVLRGPRFAYSAKIQHT